MTAVFLTGHGGFDQLEVRNDVPVPQPKNGDVLIKVLAAGVNNTDINTRIGWYSQSVVAATGDGQGLVAKGQDAGWSGNALAFPRIQGADCCGVIVAVGTGVADSRIGERVIVRTMMRSPVQYRPFETVTLGSELDGGFADYCAVPSAEAFTVHSDISDIELGAIPCAYSTAENLLHRAGLQAGETVIITGASGGVGLAAVQLARLRAAKVIAIAARNKREALLQHGADQVIDRNEDPVSALGASRADVVVDIVAGPQWSGLIDTLRPGGRYAVSGAIAGPIVSLDVRKLYLRDLTFFGCTVQDDVVMHNLVRHIENGLRPVIARTFDLQDIVAAQKLFLEKNHVGKIVLVPPHDQN